MLGGRRIRPRQGKNCAKQGGKDGCGGSMYGSDVCGAVVETVQNFITHSHIVLPERAFRSGPVRADKGSRSMRLLQSTGNLIGTI
ncbi:hypothetical protein ILFOPFJJ_05734 [Ensifer psoraleae]|nr:hypothetical protein [Sinorhizobium psoraleae]